MEPSIRQMVIEDYPEMIQFWNSCEGLGMSEADSEAGILHFLDRNPNMSFVATAGNLLVGTALGGTDGRRGFIYHLAIKPEFQKKGLGKALVHRCLETFRAAGIHKCHVVVYANNLKGQGFWEKIGWEKRQNLLIMSKQSD